MALSAGIDHKKKHSAASMELKYGKNPKDKTKRVFLDTSITRKAATLKNAIGNFKMQAEAPEYVSKNINLFWPFDILFIEF